MVGIGIFGGRLLPSSYVLWSFYVLLSGMFATLFGLFFFHGKQRDAEREKRMQYWREQVCATGGSVFSNETHNFCRLLSVRISYR